MPGSLRSAMRLLETYDFRGAADALGRLAGPAGEGVVARFRQAEALSRLGRHDEAVAAAQQAARDAPANPAAAIWLVHCLAEAGRLGDAAKVALPTTSVESLDFLRAGYAALERLSRGDRSNADEDGAAILATHHHPLYSLTLRVLEGRRVRGTVRYPDLISVWSALDCRLELADEGKKEHPEAPKPERASAAVRYLQMHWSCHDHAALIAAIRARAGDKAPDGLDEAELETHLAFGRLDEALTLSERLAETAGDDAAGELAIDRARVQQMRGEPARPRDYPGHVDAQKRLGQTVAWLEMTAALLEDDPVTARRHADQVADVAKREFVEAALAAC